MKRLLLASLLLLPFGALPVSAQQVQTVDSCGALTLPFPALGIMYMDKSGNLCTAASVSVSASIAGFSNESAGTPIAATVAGAVGTLPLTATVIAQNVGSFPAWCQKGGVGTGITTGKLLSASGGQWAFDRKTATQIFCEGVGGDTTVNMQGGTGLAIDTIAGSGAGGGGGAITAPLGHATVDTAAVSVVPSATAAFPVTGTFWQATQPVSGTFWQATQPVSGTFWQATQPVSGTVTANAGTGSFTVAQATAANLKGTMTINQGGAALSVTNGIFDNILTGNAAISVANPLMTEVVDNASHVAAVTAGGNLNVQCANCSGSGVSTNDGAAFAAGSSLFAGIGGEYSLSLPTAVVDGKQAMAAITNNRSLWIDWYNAAGTEMGTSGSPVQVSLANTATNATAVKVDGSGVTQPISGTVTANAGTNLNTSLLALETGGNLASVKTNTDNLNLGIASTTSGQKGSLPLGAVTTAAPTYTTAQSDPLSLTTAGALRVDGSGATQPISGSVSQTGTWTVQPGNTANTTAWLVTGTGGVFPASESGTWNITNVSGTVSLPTGASTAALQPTNAAQGSTTSGQTGTLGAGAVTTAAPTYTTAQTDPLSLTTAGALRVDGSGATQPVSGTITANAGTNLNTSALATDAHLVSFTSANHTDTAGITVALGTPMQNSGGSVTANAGTNLNTSALATDAHLVSFTSANHTDTAAITTALGTPMQNSGGSVTANAGTNLNTSALALETGGNLASVKTNTDNLGLAIASTTSGQKGNLNLAAVTTAAPSYTTAQSNPLSLDTSGNLRVGTPPYPLGATAETASATGTTAATTATLATAVGKTTYICSLSIRANATAAVTGNATVTGTITGTLNYTQWTSPLASGLGVTEQIFSPCVPASATNTAIAVVSAAPGSGGVVSVTATGYQL